jgi:hypothetical protein
VGSLGRGPRSSRSKTDGNDAMIFFAHVHKEQPDLLRFRSRANDPWQDIHGWSLRERKIID